MKAVRWWALLCGVVALLALTYRDLGNVLSIWFSGKETSSAVLWGLPMVWWGRIGKLMQFTAGCVVILDLIGPERLRAAGDRASGQLRDFSVWANRLREQSKLLDLQWEIQRRIIRYRNVPQVWSGYVQVFEYSDPMPDQPWFTAKMVDHLRAKIFKGLPQACKERNHEPLCEERVKYVEAQVKDFVRAGLPSRERAIYNQAQDERRLHDIKKMIIASIAPWFIMAAFLAWNKDHVRESSHLLLIVSIGSLPFMALSMLVASLVYGTPGGIVRRRAILTTSITRFAASVLDRNTPGHPLRWIGFFLFVFGFFFDLLAS